MVRFLECSYSHSLSLHPGTSMLILKMKSLAVSTRNSSQQGGQELCLFIGTRWILTQSHFLFPQNWVRPFSILNLNFRIGWARIPANWSTIKLLTPPWLRWRKTSYFPVQFEGNSSSSLVPCKAPFCFVRGQRRWKILDLSQIIVKSPHPSFSKQFNVKGNFKEC